MMRTQPRFGMRNYWRMMLRRGPRLPLYYFFNSHLFDLRHGTDTHVWLPKEYYDSRPANLDHGAMYMGSWTYEIERAFRMLIPYIDRPDQFAFVDVGCGKGKAMLVWQRLVNRHHIHQKVIGVDYYERLTQIAATNYKLLFGSAASLIVSDATAIDYASFGPRLIIYMFHPFDGWVMERVLAKAKVGETFVIYNNPVHADVFETCGYSLLAEHRGFHENCHTMIFRALSPPNGLEVTESSRYNGCASSTRVSGSLLSLRDERSQTD